MQDFGVNADMILNLILNIPTFIKSLSMYYLFWD